MSESREATVSEEFTLDDAFAVLASARRRTALRCLRATDEPVAVADLARDVAASERDVDPRDVSADAVESVYVSLHHVHLPKLADGGYLCYDDDQTCVDLTDDAKSLEPVLDWAAQVSE